MAVMKHTLKDSVFSFVFGQPKYARELYLAETYKEYVEEHKLNLYGATPVKIPRTEKAISEIIRRYIEEKVLAPFLEARQKEVAEIMVTLFDQEKIMEMHDYHIAEAARREGIKEGIKEGVREGIQKGRTEGLVDALKSLIQNSGMAAEKAMELLGIPETARSQYAEMLKQ